MKVCSKFDIQSWQLGYYLMNDCFTVEVWNQFLVKQSSYTKLRNIFFHLVESNVTRNIIKHLFAENLC